MRQKINKDIQDLNSDPEQINSIDLSILNTQNIHYPQNLTIYLKIYKDSKQGDGKKLTNQMESKNK